MVDFPPYVMNSSGVTQRGFLYKQIIYNVETACLGQQSFDDPPTCCVEPLFVNTSDEMIQLIKDKEVDLAFPFQAEAEEKLKNFSYVTLIRAYVAKGSSLIVNTKECQAESRQQLMTSITSQWPILACIILLSGISGVIIWLLVGSCICLSLHLSSKLMYFKLLVPVWVEVKRKYHGLRCLIG